MNDLHFLKQTPGEELLLTEDPAPFYRKYAKGRCAVFTGGKGVEANGAWQEFSAAVPMRCGAGAQIRLNR